MPLDMALSTNDQNPMDIRPCREFTSKRVLHVILDVASTELLEFELKYVAPGSETDAASYVKNLTSSFDVIPRSPFDIVLDYDTDEQQWIVVELGKTADWCFTAGSHGVTCKEGADGRVFDPHWVDGSKNSVRGAIPAGQEGCKLIWFGLAQLDHGAAVALNYHVTVSQTGKLPDGTPVVKRMKIIFDPDVRNEGDPIPL